MPCLSARETDQTREMREVSDFCTILDKASGSRHNPRGLCTRICWGSIESAMEGAAQPSATCARSWPLRRGPSRSGVSQQKELAHEPGRSGVGWQHGLTIGVHTAGEGLGGQRDNRLCAMTGRDNARRRRVSASVAFSAARSSAIALIRSVVRATSAAAPRKRWADNGATRRCLGSHLDSERCNRANL